jgi:hypothetical protein
MALQAARLRSWSRSHHLERRSVGGVGNPHAPTVSLVFQDKHLMTKRASAKPSHRIHSMEMLGIVKRFPGVLANDHVDFDVQAGENSCPARREWRR